VFLRIANSEYRDADNLLADGALHSVRNRRTAEWTTAEFSPVLSEFGSWFISVSIVSDYTPDNRDSIPGGGKGYFL
jgi:hypothetical protein